MQAGIIVRGFIASPSDVQEERERALDVVTKWNAANSLYRSMVIEAVRVETHAEAQVDGTRRRLSTRLTRSLRLPDRHFLVEARHADPKAVSGPLMRSPPLQEPRAGRR